MNSKTAKLIRRLSHFATVPYEVLKREWNKSPRTVRSKLREVSRNHIAKYDATFYGYSAMGKTREMLP